MTRAVHGRGVDGRGRGGRGGRNKGGKGGTSSTSSSSGSSTSGVLIPRDTSKYPSGILEQENTTVQQKIDKSFLPLKGKESTATEETTETESDSPKTKRTKSNDLGHSNEAGAKNGTENISDNIWVRYVSRDAKPFLKEEINYVQSSTEDNT